MKLFNYQYRSSVRQLLLTTSVFVWLGVGIASAQTIDAGTDCYRTDAGSDNTAGIPFLDADFFASGSAAVLAQAILVEGLPLVGGELAACGVCQNDDALTWVDRHGDPVEPDSRHRVGQAIVDVDTCVSRPVTATFPGGVGAPDPIPVEIIQLSLQSVTPLEVNIGGVPTFFDVFITEDGVQTQGVLTLTPDSLGTIPTGNMVLNGLPVNFQIQFQEVGGGIAQSISSLSLNLQSSSGTFNAAIPPDDPNAENNIVPAGINPATLLVLMFVFTVVLWGFFVRRR